MDTPLNDRNREKFMNFNEYYWAIAAEAVKLGYNITQIGIFKADIEDCFNDEKSVEEAINEVF